MDNKIYIIGHKSPDLDSVAASISYAYFKNKISKNKNYIPAIPGPINQLTKFILKKFNFVSPKILKQACNKNLILVDHNESSQIVEKGEDANIIEILDHHKINFSSDKPIEITIKPWGSSNSIIYQKYKDNKIRIPKKLAALMLSAILDDTVITKSPTCTKFDKKIIKELSQIANIKNWQQYGIEMFKIKSDLKNIPAAKIVRLDFKDYNFKNKKFGFGQIETVSLVELNNRKTELLSELKKLHREKKYHTTLLMITDIMQEGSLVLIITNEEKLCAKALKNKIQNQEIFIPGLVSRKKQLVPGFNKIFN